MDDVTNSESSLQLLMTVDVSSTVKCVCFAPSDMIIVQSVEVEFKLDERSPMETPTIVVMMVPSILVLECFAENTME